MFPTFPNTCRSLIHSCFSTSKFKLPQAASYTQSAQRVGFRQSDVAREFTPQLRNNARLVHFSEGLASALQLSLASYVVSW